jgi:2'-hydroxyisoflavone reductase
MESMLIEMAQALGTTPELLFASDEFLLEHEVRPFSELPLWLPKGREAMLTANTAKAQGAGLCFRPLSRTVTDVLRWDADRGSPELKAGLSPERAAKLRDAWQRAAH